MLYHCPPTEPTNFEFWVKLLAPIATLIVSIVNLVIVIVFFNRRNEKEDRDTRRKQRIDWFKTLILDSNLTHFYQFFDAIEGEMHKLAKTSSPNDSLKEKVNEAIKAHQRTFRLRFVDALLAVDKSLYEEVVKIADSLTDRFTESIFDSGINLHHPPKYEEIVITPLSETKTSMIRQILSYEGD